MSHDLETRLRRLEDRTAISEVVVKYGLAVDRRDWALFADCFTDPVDTDYSGLGSPAKEWERDAFVESIRLHLSGFTATQHISPNHLVAFDEQDPDRAICTSYMYAQHYLEGSPNGDFYLARGFYTITCSVLRRAGASSGSSSTSSGKKATSRLSRNRPHASPNPRAARPPRVAAPGDGSRCAFCCCCRRGLRGLGPWPAVRPRRPEDPYGTGPAGGRAGQRRG